MTRTRGAVALAHGPVARSEEHTSELQSQSNLVCRLLLEKKKNNSQHTNCSNNTTGINPTRYVSLTTPNSRPHRLPTSTPSPYHYCNTISSMHSRITLLNN